jgi:hypothetical protein
VVILTSNLGTRQAARDIGFAPAESTADSVYLKAVEEFFRPEFLNRLDRIVPFQRLERGELEQIARAILADVVAREGLTRRKCAIELDGDALAWIVERGYHRALGARAMRRAVERELVRPMAQQLAAIAPDVPTVMTARRTGDALTIQVAPLVESPRRADLARPERIDDRKDLLSRARAALNRIQDACDAHRPPLLDADGRIVPQYHWYSGVIEFLRQTRLLATAIADEETGPRRGRPGPMISPKQGRPRYDSTGHSISPSRKVLKEIYAAQDVVEYVKYLAAEAGAPASSERPDVARCRRLLDRLALADALAPGPTGWPAERALVVIRGAGDADGAREAIANHLCAKYGAIHAENESARDEEADAALGLECMHWKQTRGRDDDRLWWEAIHDATFASDRYRLEVLVVEGYKANTLLEYETGTHLCVSVDGRLEPVQVVVVPIGDGQSPWDPLLSLLRRHEERSAASESADANTDPFHWRPTVSLHVLDGQITDLQSGTIGLHGGNLMAALPLPPELRDLIAGQGGS